MEGREKEGENGRWKGRKRERIVGGRKGEGERE